MNHTTIQGFARQAGIPKWIGHNGMYTDVSDYLVKFAKLIAAHERERCAQVCDAEVQTDITHAKIAWDSMGEQSTPFPQSPEDTLVYSSAARCAAAIRALSNEDAK